MSTFSEYAALARHLADQRRETDQDAAAETARRRALHASADQLAQRLAGQGHRLDQLGRALGLPPPADPGPTAPPSGPGPATEAGTVLPGGAAAAPGRAGVGAYPGGAVSGALVALPTAAGVPAPRAGGGDPAAELAEARRLADEADRLVGVTEAVARYPTLLPTWSPMSRAVAVYAGSAAAGILLALVLLNAGGLVLGAGALYAASCAGLPVLCFVAGYLVLGRWGRPALGAEGPPPRFVPLGFVICVLLVPLAQCGYLLLSRLAP
ncbi:hypothetical protein [Micromonospora sp. DT233]|uniref:hypothetical protein n=1 Tax=Micromonospora sp. DT233 TaxID=3393432 RepID=UPI003CFA59D7